MKRFVVNINAGTYYALADSKNPDHARMTDFLENQILQLVTTNFVFDESVTLIRFRLGFAAAKSFGLGLLPASAALLLSVGWRDKARAGETFTCYLDGLP